MNFFSLISLNEILLQTKSLINSSREKRAVPNLPKVKRKNTLKSEEQPVERIVTEVRFQDFLRIIFLQNFCYYLVIMLSIRKRSQKISFLQVGWHQLEGTASNMGGKNRKLQTGILTRRKTELKRTSVVSRVVVILFLLPLCLLFFTTHDSKIQISFKIEFKQFCNFLLVKLMKQWYILVIHVKRQCVGVFTFVISGVALTSQFA